MYKYRGAESPSSSDDEELVSFMPERKELFPTKTKDSSSKAMSSEVEEFLLKLKEENPEEHRQLIELKDEILREIVENPELGDIGVTKLYYRLIDKILPQFGDVISEKESKKTLGKLDYLISQISRYNPKSDIGSEEEIKLKKGRVDQLVILIVETMGNIDDDDSSKSRDVSDHLKRDLNELNSETIEKIAALNLDGSKAPSAKPQGRKRGNELFPPMKRSKSNPEFSKSEESRPLSFKEELYFSELSGLSEFEGDESDNEEQEREGAKSAPPDISPKKKGGLRSRKRKGKKHKTTKKRGKKRTMKRRKRRKRNKQKTRKSLR